MATTVTAFAPATVSNVACGFDVLGFALDAPGDRVTARLTSSGVTIDDITGDGGRLPREALRNTAGVAAQALLTALGERRGVALSISKGLPLASGLGGSAASAAAAVVAVDAALQAHAPMDMLIACALEGERLGAASPHADNVAPSICGGLYSVTALSACVIAMIMSGIPPTTPMRQLPDPLHRIVGPGQRPVFLRKARQVCRIGFAQQRNTLGRNTFEQRERDIRQIVDVAANDKDELESLRLTGHQVPQVREKSSGGLFAFGVGQHIKLIQK